MYSSPYISFGVETNRGEYNATAFGLNSIIENTLTFTPSFDIDSEKVKPKRDNYAQETGFTSNKWGEISFSIIFELSSVGSAPNVDTLLESCGFQSTTPAGGYLYQKTKSNLNKTLSINYYQKDICSSTPNYKKYKLSGCMGNVIFGVANTGGIVKVDFRFKGKYVGYENVTSIPSIGTYTGDKAKYLNSELLIDDTYNLLVSSWFFDAGNNIVEVPKQNDVTGIGYYRIGKTNPKFTLNPYEQDDVNLNLFWENNTLHSIDVKIPKTSTIFQINIPNAMIQTKNNIRRNGLFSSDITIIPTKNNGSNANLLNNSNYGISAGTV